MAHMPDQPEFQYGTSYVAIDGREIPLQSTSVTYLRYGRGSLQYELGYRQGIVFVLDENVDKGAVASQVRDAIASSLSDKLALRDYAGNPLLCRLELMATNGLELLRKEKS